MLLQFHINDRARSHLLHKLWDRAVARASDIYSAMYRRAPSDRGFVLTILQARPADRPRSPEMRELDDQPTLCRKRLLEPIRSQQCSEHLFKITYPGFHLCMCCRHCSRSRSAEPSIYSHIEPVGPLLERLTLHIQHAVCKCQQQVLSITQTNTRCY